MSKKPRKKASKSKSTKKSKLSVVRAAPPDRLLRQHVLYLLKEGGAHIGFDDVMNDWPVQLAGAKVANFPHTAWMLLEHLRLAQQDILEFSRNPKHVSPAWPEGYWPEAEAPPNEKAWKDSIASVKKDLKAMEALISSAKADLYARLPWGDGQTLLREALLVADHNSYHVGQLAMLRKCIGI